MDHLLFISDGRGNGAEGCEGAPAEFRETLEKDNEIIKKIKQKKQKKKQRIQRQIAMTYNPIPSSGNASQSTRSSGIAASNSLWKTIQKQEVDDAVADMFFESAIPFNVARSPYFINACKKIANFGKGYVPPSAEMLRTTLLKRSKERVTNRFHKIKESWKDTGCTILSGGCSDMCDRLLINVLVCCPKGVLLLKVVDATYHNKTSEYIFKILEEAIIEVGEENVVQVVTDSASNCEGAGKMIMDKYKRIYWTPCTAHCLDLLLHDLTKFAWINEAISKGKQISHFIFNHHLTLSLYRKKASRELLRPCDTRFATYYITLKRVVEEKTSIRSVFCSFEWENSRLSKESKGKDLEQIILSNAFWESAVKVLKVCEPIVDMLRMVDSDTPSMGLVYDGMNRCKEAIAKSFNNVKDEYMEIWNVIDEKWKTLHSPLHAAAYYLNPRLFERVTNNDARVMDGLYAAIERLTPDLEESRRLREQLRAYKLEEGIFERTSAINDRAKTSPRLWWWFYGSESPELQHFAIRVLSQGSSASPCERKEKGTGVALAIFNPRKEIDYYLHSWKTLFMFAVICNWPQVLWPKIHLVPLTRGLSLFHMQQKMILASMATLVMNLMLMMMEFHILMNLFSSFTALCPIDDLMNLMLMMMEFHILMNLFSSFTALCPIDDLELYDVTSRPSE